MYNSWDAEKYIITKAAAADMKAIRSLLEDYRNQVYTGELEEGIFFVAKLGNRIIWTAREFVEADRYHMIFTVVVLPEYRWQHLWLRIVSEVIRHSESERIFIDCRKALVPYYERLGATVYHEADRDIIAETVWIGDNELLSILKKDLKDI